jgi:hypothetical protein
MYQPVYSGGKGTLDDPYRIATVDNLLYLLATSTDWDKSFILTADIDLTGNTFEKAPIAPDTDDATDEFQGTSFSGTFDGNGHAIRNLTIDNTVSPTTSACSPTTPIRKLRHRECPYRCQWSYELPSAPWPDMDNTLCRNVPVRAWFPAT